MPEALTFTSIKSDITKFIERGTSSDTTVYEQIPRLVNQAERAIATALKVQGFIQVVIGELAVGTSVYPKPDRWRETISMVYGIGTDNEKRKPIYARSYEYCRSYWPNPALRDAPRFYSDYDDKHWLIVPTPVALYPWEVVYYAAPPLLDGTNQTNWLTDFAPNLLLYRALFETAIFLEDDAKAGKYKTMYDEQLASVNEQDLRRIVDRNSTRQRA